MVSHPPPLPMFCRRCKRCKTGVDRAAKFCSACGYRVRSRWRTIRGGLIIFFGLFFGLAFLGSFLPKPPVQLAQETTAAAETSLSAIGKSETPPKPKEKIGWLTPSQLVNAYTNNEVNADHWFKGTLVAVRGRVEKIGRDLTGSAYVILTDGNLEHGIRRVQAFFDDDYELSQLTRNQTVAVEGGCRGMSMNVVLVHCRFIPKPELGRQYH